MILWLVRHGETADNAARIFQGQSGKGLNRRGRAQAGRIAERLAKAPPARIFASDLERAFETATIIGQACGRTVEPDRDLREVDVGLVTARHQAQHPAVDRRDVVELLFRFGPDALAADEGAAVDLERAGALMPRCRCHA